jgi:putative DNA methylase
VKSPNPAFRNVDVPLASSFILTPMAGKEAYVQPVIEKGGYHFTVHVGKPSDSDVTRKGTKSGGSGSSFLCLMSGTPMPFDYLRAEAKAGRMGSRLMAIIAESDQGRTYLTPTVEHEAIARGAKAHEAPETGLPDKALGFRVQEYGMTKWRDLFTPRQLMALTTFSDLVGEAMDRIRCDAVAADVSDDDESHNEPTAYANAVATYLGFLVGKLADKGSTICTWDAGPASNRTASGRSARVATVRVTFGRQALPMTWDYAEVNFFSDSVGSIETVLKTLSIPLTYLPVTTLSGRSEQGDAQSQNISAGKVISTDPPYYDNIGYADLSDFFYVWLRRSLRSIFPQLFATVAVPKAEELVATPYRHGNRENAEAFFLDGMTHAMRRLAEQGHPAFPITIYYAFKQSESESDAGTVSTGWETFLDAVVRAGFGISGTLPMRTELSSRMVGRGTNALASSIVLVCRPESIDAPTAARRDFVAALQQELPSALRHLQAGNIAPVDLAQAAIGPGMAVFTRYSKVLDAQDKPLRVRDALAAINQVLDEALAEQEGDFDADTRWALAWFEQYGFADGEFGVAETLSKAKNTSVGGIVDAGIARSKAGKVRLLKPNELPADWDPTTDFRLTHWEIVHHLIRALEGGGESAAAEIVTKLGSKAETARELCYRLYTLCERKKRAAEALSYNALVQSWPEILRLAKEQASAVPLQQELV